MQAPSHKEYKLTLCLPEFPKLFFLDTNVVQNLLSFGDFIYDNSLSPEASRRISSKGPRIFEDIYALADLMALGRRVGWPLAVSSRTLMELNMTPQPGKRLALINWGTKLAHYFDSNFNESQDIVEGSSYAEINHFTFTQRQRLCGLLSALPQEADRQLIIDAFECGCDIFLTMDYKTLWSYRGDVNRLLGLQVMRPVELLERVRPWVGLLR